MALTTKQVRLASLIVENQPNTDQYELQVLLMKLYNPAELDDNLVVSKDSIENLLSPMLTSAEIAATIQYLESLGMIMVTMAEGGGVAYGLAPEVRRYIEVHDEFFE